MNVGRLSFCQIAVLVIATVGAVVARAEEPAAAKPIRVVIFNDIGAGDEGPTNIERCLAGPGFTVKRVKGVDIRDGALNDADVLIHPGGSGSKQATALQDLGRERVRKFVDAGGGYVGICAGAYLATTDYTWSLGILDARVIDRAHWARGTGNVELKLSTAGCKFFAIPNDTAPKDAKPKDVVTIYYGQGPLLAPGERDDVPDYEELAEYQTEIAKKGAPTGVMKGTTAAALGKFGHGRVFCFSPHPEKTDGMDHTVRAAVTWAATK